ncbi:ABC transporter ATP-binding protein [Streptomyces sp. NPDC051976]|uniref:ABC transporter ATP-binding protein n=1 Tax=Streptomyces sp. NPDC051976 TaxID=3154947 RepID=UPI00342F24B6
MRGRGRPRLRGPLRRPGPPGDQPVSASEEELFGGALRYDTGFSQYEYAYLDLTLLSMARSLPQLVGGTLRLAWRADRRALVAVGLAELGRGVGQAAGLLITNRVLRALFATGDTPERLRAALPALVTAASVAVVIALLAAVSTAGTGRLEPKVERLATEQYLAGAARVELSAIEDAEFHKLLDSARYGTASARRMIGTCVAALNGTIAFAASASVLTVLHPVLLPLLALIALPRSWGALRVAQRRYTSMMNWIEHARAGHLLGSLLTERTAAPEVRVHGVGPFLLGHFRQMSETAEAEQTRLADERALTELLAAAMSGAATLATYCALAALMLSGGMPISVAGTAVLAIRTGSSSLAALVTHVNQAYEEALFVRDLERLVDQAAERSIPSGGLAVGAPTGQIRFEDVTFTYPDRTAPALDSVTLTIPAGKVVALVGENGSGKSTLVKVLAGLHLPDSGRVLWDGVDAALADRDQLFAQVAMVTQDFQRWPFTAESNVVIGQPDIPVQRERLDGAVDYAGARELVDSLPRGLRTLLARQFRGGHELSGGQWQRIGIGRARYRKASVIICDEPTSALDPKAEIETFDKIRGLAAGGQTVLLVTHRLAAVRHADLIYVLHEGRVVEEGSHRQLLARPEGRYRTLFRLQSDQYAADPVPDAR